MPKLPRIPSALVIRALKRARFYEYHQSGSHMQLRHLDNLALRVTVPRHNRDLAPKTLREILRSANLAVEQFIEFL